MENSPFSSPCSARVSYQGRLRAAGGSLMRNNTGILPTRHLPITKGKRSTAAFLGRSARELEKAWLKYGLGAVQCKVSLCSYWGIKYSRSQDWRDTTIPNVCSSVGSGLWGKRSIWGQLVEKGGLWFGQQTCNVTMLTSWLAGCGAEAVLVLGKQTLEYFGMMSNPIWSSLSDDSEQV